MKPDYALQRQRQLAQQALDAELLALAEARTAAMKAKVRELRTADIKAEARELRTAQQPPRVHKPGHGSDWSLLTPAAIFGAAIALDIL